MSRLTRPSNVNENPNPCTKFLQWKSNDKCFEYYDKETKERVKVELPLKVLFLEHYHTVKGWSDSAGSGIWSNEVYSIGSEEVEVKNSNGVIAKGIYKEKRTEIKNAGGVYHRSIYCMTPEGEIVNLQLKGAVIGGLDVDTAVDKIPVFGWSTFYSGDKKKNIKGISHLLDNQFFVINQAKEGKKGSVKYSVPFFEVGEHITREQNQKAHGVADTLQAYMDVYFSNDKEQVKEDQEEDKRENEVLQTANLDDLAF
jgi:hypothetical protein